MPLVHILYLLMLIFVGLMSEINLLYFSIRRAPGGGVRQRSVRRLRWGDVEKEGYPEAERGVLPFRPTTPKRSKWVEAGLF